MRTRMLKNKTKNTFATVETEVDITKETPDKINNFNMINTDQGIFITITKTVKSNIRNRKRRRRSG